MRANVFAMLLVFGLAVGALLEPFAVLLADAVVSHVVAPAAVRAVATSGSLVLAAAAGIIAFLLIEARDDIGGFFVGVALGALGAAAVCNPNA